MKFTYPQTVEGVCSAYMYIAEHAAEIKEEDELLWEDVEPLCQSSIHEQITMAKLFWRMVRCCWEHGVRTPLIQCVPYPQLSESSTEYSIPFLVLNLPPVEEHEYIASPLIRDYLIHPWCTIVRFREWVFDLDTSFAKLAEEESDGDDIVDSLLQSDSTAGFGLNYSDTSVDEFNVGCITPFVMYSTTICGKVCINLDSYFNVWGPLTKIYLIGMAYLCPAVSDVLIESCGVERNVMVHCYPDSYYESTMPCEIEELLLENKQISVAFPDQGDANPLRFEHDIQESHLRSIQFKITHHDHWMRCLNPLKIGFASLDRPNVASNPCLCKPILCTCEGDECDGHLCDCRIGLNVPDCPCKGLCDTCGQMCVCSIKQGKSQYKCDTCNGRYCECSFVCDCGLWPCHCEVMPFHYEAEPYLFIDTIIKAYKSNCDRLSMEQDPNFRPEYFSKSRTTPPHVVIVEFITLSSDTNTYYEFPSRDDESSCQEEDKMDCDQQKDSKDSKNAMEVSPDDEEVDENIIECIDVDFGVFNGVLRKVTDGSLNRDCMILLLEMLGTSI